MRRRNREMLQWIRRVVAPYALVVPGGLLEAIVLFFPAFVDCAHNPSPCWQQARVR